MTYSNRKEDLNKVSNMVRVDNIEDVKIAEVTSDSIYIIFSWSSSGIQFTWSRFKLIKFNDSRKKQVGELVRYRDIMTSMVNIPVVEDDNCLSF